MPLILLCLLLLAACTPVGVMVGAGATAGSAALSEQGVASTAKDAVIKTKILAALADHTFDHFARLDVTVYDGTVLLTGDLPDAQARLDAVRIAWQADRDIKTIVNEITLSAEPIGLGDRARDAQIAGSIRAALTLEKEIYAVNYSLAVHRGVVYVMGLAQNQVELSRVQQIIRRTEYVRGVKNLVQVKK
jgi:osmotically-inducible protein OsmY